MEIFNIGPLELLFILVIALVVIGPGNLEKNARKAGLLIYRLLRSPAWTALISNSREILDLPNRLVREAGIEESLKEMQNSTANISRELDETYQALDPRNQPYKPFAPEPDHSVEKPTSQVHGEDNPTTPDSSFEI
jgi:hypothetical protein